MDRQADEWADLRAKHRYRTDAAPICADAFAAEQDMIEALHHRSDAEYARVNGRLPVATIAPWADRACPLCRGKGYIGARDELAHCPQCDGCGAESIVRHAAE